MEAIGKILGGMKPPSNGRTADSARSRSASREEALERLIVRLYASARKELPEDGALAMEVRMAMVDLREIPDHGLSLAFQEAQVQAGAFIPSNGLIVRAWRENKAKSHDDAQKAIRNQNTRRYLLANPVDLPTDEQREANAKAAADIARRLRGDA